MPEWAGEVRTRLAGLVLSPERDREIVDELSQHLEDRWQELMAGGASQEGATRLALAEFTSPDALARRMAPLRQSHVTPPVSLGAPSTNLLSDAWRDLRYTQRLIAREPGFASLVILLLIGSFSVLAVVLTLVGLYGTLAYLVMRRQREIGIRMAVGATRSQIRHWVVSQGAVLIATGIPIGLIASVFTSRFASSLLFEVRPADPLVLATVAMVLAVASFAAVLVPAIRATRVEPVMTLRGE
jgi:hypothetical protein